MRAAHIQPFAHKAASDPASGFANSAWVGGSWSTATIVAERIASKDIVPYQTVLVLRQQGL